MRTDSTSSISCRFWVYCFVITSMACAVDRQYSNYVVFVLFWQFCMRKTACESKVVFLWTYKFVWWIWPIYWAKKENRQKLGGGKQFVTDFWFYCSCCCFYFSVLHILHVLLVSKTEVLIFSSSWSHVLTRVGPVLLLWSSEFFRRVSRHQFVPSDFQTSGNSLLHYELWTSSALSSQVSNS